MLFFLNIYKEKTEQKDTMVSKQEQYIRKLIRECLNESMNKKYVAYHGGDKLDDFDYNKIGSSNHGNIYGNGFYFTTNYEMALDFAFKSGKYYGYIYTCEIIPNNPLIVSEKELNKLQFDYLKINDDINLFWDNIKKTYDCIIVNNRIFGGSTKFPTKYENFTEIVVYDKSIIKIINKEKQ